MSYEKFSKMVNKYIKDQSITEIELSEEMGISKSHLHKIIMSDMNIPITALIKAAAFFKMQLQIKIK